MMEATAFFGRPDAVVVLITSEMGHKQASYRPRSPAMSAHLAFVDNATLPKKTGPFGPGCYRFATISFLFWREEPPALSSERLLHDLRGFFVGAGDQVTIDVQRDRGLSVAKAARDSQNVHALSDQH